jgi:hypothetical protein
VNRDDDDGGRGDGDHDPAPRGLRGRAGW